MSCNLMERLEAAERAELVKLNRNTRIRQGLEKPMFYGKKRKAVYQYQADKQFDRSYVKP